MSDMASAFASGVFAEAQPVPVWTKPQARQFTAQPGGPASSFTSWVSEPAAPEPQMAAAMAMAEAPPLADIEQLQADAYAQGFDEGHRTAFAAIDVENGAMDRLATALMNVRAEPPADLARLLSETVSRLVRQVVGEVQIDAELMAERTHAVAAMIAEDSAPARLRLHPDDLARIDGLRPDLKLVADPSLAEGSVVAETASGWIEDGPAIRMEKLKGVLDALGCRR